MQRFEYFMIPKPENLMALESQMQDILEEKGDGSDFIKNFTDLLDAIFVGSSSSAWVLETEPQVVRQIVKLLGPQGLFFQILLKYTSNSTVKFKFQYENLPYFTHHLICKGGENLKKIAPLFKTKMDESFSVQLNMLEYFIFYFALSPTISHNTEPLASRTTYHSSVFTPSFFSKSSAPKEKEDCYISLLNEYVNSLWNTNYSVRPMVGSYFSSYSDLFLNVFVQFWLCQSGIDVISKVIYRPPTTRMVQSIKLLLLHFIRGNPDFDFSLDYQGFSRTHSSYGGAVDKMKRCLEAVSLPLYGFLKINISESLKSHPQHFIEIIDLWLLFLRPWHAVSSEKKLFRPKPPQPFKILPFAQKLLEGLSPEKWRASFEKRGKAPLVDVPLATTSGTGTNSGMSNTEHTQTGRGHTVYTDNVIRTQVHFNLAFYVHLLSLFLATTVKSQSDTEKHALYPVLRAYKKDLLDPALSGETIFLSVSKDPTVIQVQRSYHELEKEPYIPIRCRSNCENAELLVQDLNHWAEREKRPMGRLGKKDRWQDTKTLIQMTCEIFGIPESGKNIPPKTEYKEYHPPPTD